MLCLRSKFAGDGENICTEFPPLMQAKSWTKGVPYRDSFEHNKPADTIGYYHFIIEKSWE